MAVFQRRRPWSLRGGEMRIITLTLLTALACAGPVAEQAAQEPVASSIDAETRAALEKARDVVWRAWFAGDTATLAQIGRASCRERVEIEVGGVAGYRK